MRPTGCGGRGPWCEVNELSQTTEELIGRGDTPELIRHIDRLVEHRDFAGLLSLRDACDSAAERGHQLWPVRSNAEYRLALEAPPSEAAAVVVQGAGFGALGPLTEVVAQNHSFAELAPHLDDATVRAVVAQERVIRGENVEGEPLAEPSLLEIPGVISAWESYTPARYEPHDASFPGPVFGTGDWQDLGPATELIDDLDTQDAVRTLVEPWVATGSGRMEMVTVEGSAEAAVAAIGITRARWERLDQRRAADWMGWVGASAGANGRRRGMAAGRLNTWWLLAALADCDVDQHADIGRFMDRARWFRFDIGEPAIGWQFRLAVDDPETGLAWAITAQDF